MPFHVQYHLNIPQCSLYHPGWEEKLNTWASGHPGKRRTLEIIQGKYWWPSMAHDVNVHLALCRTCAQSRVPWHFPTGKLMPLPSTKRLWSHIAVDFITDLPESEGCTKVFVVADRFSEGIKLIPLPALPTALKVAELLFHQVFGYYGIPENIVSDGRQFISVWVWAGFMEKLGVTTSFTSDYHPQSNQKRNIFLFRYLRSYCADNQNDYARLTPWVECAQKSLKHSATNMIPFQCILGFEPPLIP